MVIKGIVLSQCMSTLLRFFLKLTIEAVVYNRPCANVRDSDYFIDDSRDK